MRRLTRGTIREARNILTLTRARTSGSGVAGVAIPQPTAQNEMLIADATPAWTLLAAPTGEFQVPVAGADPYTPAWAVLTVEAISDLAYATPALTLSTANAEGAAATVIRSDATVLVFDATAPNTIEPDDAAVVGTATVAARRDHEHAIVCAAPADPSVSLAASAEGTGTSFARADHAHQLDQAITPTWTGAHVFDQAISAAKDTDATSHFGRTAIGNSSYSDTATFAHLDHNSQTGYALRQSHLGDTVLNAAAGRELYLMLGNVQRVRIATGATVFNEGGADIDHRWEAVGQVNALFVEGSTGNIGCKTGTPAGKFHIIGSIVTNVHRPAYGTPTMILDDGSANAVTLQLAARDYSARMCHIVMTAAPTTGNNKHWIISHLGIDANNRFSIGYLSSTATGFSTWSDVDEYLTISTAGNVAIDGDTTYRFNVYQNTADYMAQFFNDGGDNRHGIRIQIGEDANPDEYFLRFFDGNGTGIGRIEGDGAGGVTYHSASDERLKTILGPIDRDLAIEALTNVNPIRFIGRGKIAKTGRINVGFSAQDIHRYFPEVATYDGKEDRYGLSYGRLVPVLWAQNQAILARLEKGGL